MNRNTKVYGVVLIGITFGLVVTLALLASRPVQADEQDGGKPSASKPVAVEVAQPVKRPLKRMLRMPATLLPGEMADLYAKTSGYITTVSVDIGSHVSKEDALITIDVPEMKDELHQAQAVLSAKSAKVKALQAKGVQAQSMVDTARADVQRYEAEYTLRKITADRQKKLREENAISQQDFDEVQSKLAIAQALVKIAQAKVVSAQAERQAVLADASVATAEVAVEQARVARLMTLMRYATIRAPFDGIIIKRMVDPGAFVRSAAEGTTTPLLTVANASYIRLALDIPENDTPYVRIGTKMAIKVKALGDDLIQAAVTRTAVALRAETRTMRVEVDLDNKDGRLVPGMYAQVVVTLESKKQAMMIPSKAIRVRGRDMTVLVADGGMARAKPITAGYDDGIWVEITKGLNGTEQVIVAANGVVAPGAPVRVAQANTAS